MKAFLAAVVVLLVFASSGFAQTIYEPVRFQYGTENRKFYYAGSDPVVIVRGFYYGPRTVSNEPLRIYSDFHPGFNVARYGYTIDDARNEANFSQPRYFTKRGVGGVRY